MPDARRTARILAMQVLFQLDYQGEGFLSFVNDFLRDECDEPAIIEHARRLVDGVWKLRDALDARIDAAAEHWSLDRMPGVDRNILRIASYEMVECDRPPAKVAMNEAIEIAKTFGSAESPQFINGMLDAIWKAHGSGNSEAVVPANHEQQGD